MNIEGNVSSLPSRTPAKPRVSEGSAHYQFAVGSISHLQRKSGLTCCTAAEEAKGQWPVWAVSPLALHVRFCAYHGIPVLLQRQWDHDITAPKTH